MGKKVKKTDALKLRLTIDRVIAGKGSKAELAYVETVAKTVHKFDMDQHKTYEKILRRKKLMFFLKRAAIGVLIGAAIILLYYILS